jgi:chorismate dehydratase
MDSFSHPLHVGCVSFFNSKPLIYGLETEPGIQLSLDVPSRLLAGLAEKRFDVALLPVIDYQKLDGLTILPAGGIGCRGPTLTVRIFSPAPIERITTLACDGDSHTSVALARILLAERYGIRPEFVPLGGPGGQTDGPGVARLLIGDKVVCAEPAGFPHQLDLGEAWNRWTGLPFVFAVWMARQGVEIGTLPARLEKAKRAGVSHIEDLIERFALPAGWPAETARKYLTEYLQYDIGDEQLAAIRLFHMLAHRHGLIVHEPWELAVFNPLIRRSAE